jgi:hypothetical protein
MASTPLASDMHAVCNRLARLSPPEQATIDTGGKKMKARLVLGLVAVSVLLGIFATGGFADSDPTTVGPHRHWIGEAWTGPEIGPKLCDKPDNAGVRAAFIQYHNNAHVSGGQGPAAPGLHNDRGGEIVASPCIRP